MRSTFSFTSPLRMQNLASLKFDEHLHWPQGRRKPALLTFRADETKNDVVLEFEIPTALAERLQVYRNEIAPAVIGKRPDAVFVSLTGKPRTQAAIKVAIEKTVLRHLGVKITPHQFRHLAAKIALDANPGAYELVRQLLGHKNLKTTTNILRRHRHPPGRTCSRRPHHEAPRIQVGPGPPSPDTSAARGLAPCADLNRDCTYPMTNGRQPTGCSGSGPWAAMIPSPMQPVLAWPRPRSITICSHGGGSSGSWRSTNPPHWKSLRRERLTIERVRSFVAHLAETNTPQSVAAQVDALYKAARVMMPERDWTWLKAVKARLYRGGARVCSNAGPSSPASSCSTLGSS